MKNIRKIFAGLAAVSMIMGLTACGDSDGGSTGGNSAGTEAPVTTTTTAATVEKNTETLNEEAQAAVDDISSQLKDEELENKTIKWLAHYDSFNPSTSGNSKALSLEFFETKYGGNIQWYPTTWDNRYNDLSTYVLGGEGIDFFPCDTNALPKGVISGMFQPVDDYIDLGDDLWKDLNSAMEIYNFNGKHYEFAISVSAEEVVFYNAQTIEENGLDDPYELWEKGEWNWDTFKELLLAYVDEDNDCYGLDNWFNEKALFLSAGVPLIESVDGHLKSNIMDPTVEKAMNYQYDLFNNGLVLDLGLFDWSTQTQFIGEGKELFNITGSWDINAAPEVWAMKVEPDNLRMVPVPSPAGEPNYMAATIDGWCLCKGSANPEGVARFAECAILASKDPGAVEIADQKARDDYGWTDHLIETNRKINELAAEHPVVDLASGVSQDVASLTTDGGSEIGLRAAFHGKDWATNREEIGSVVETLVQEADDQLAAMS